MINPEPDASPEPQNNPYLNRVSTLQVAAVPAGGWLLNSGAATAVGKMIISIAKAKGIKTINLVRVLTEPGDRSQDFMRSLAVMGYKPS